MTTTQKKEIVDNILELIIQLTEDGEYSAPQTECGGNMVRFRLPTRDYESAWFCPCQPVCIRQKYIDRAVASILGKADLLTLQETVDYITTDWNSITVKMKNGETQTVNISFDKITDIPAQTLEEKEHELLIDIPINS